MLKDSVRTLSRTRLPELGAIRVRGTDALRFLQGQLSNDTALLGPDRPQLAGLHNPQGRVIAVLRVLALAPDDVLAVLPRELAAPVTARLSKYVLRAKAKVTDASEESATAGPASMISAPADDVAAGVPQVYAATSEQFVSQMLNLDVLGAISFTKGCYTGQEVIARAHYRGRVKRRMQRFRTLAPAHLAPADVGTLRDGRSFRVVNAVQLDDGRCEFLAVAPMNPNEPANAAEVETVDAAPEAASAQSLEVEALALPYELPR